MSSQERMVYTILEEQFQNLHSLLQVYMVSSLDLTFNIVINYYIFFFGIGGMSKSGYDF